MFKEIEEFSKHIILAGFKNVKISDVDSLFRRIRRVTKNPVQIFDAERIAGWRHLYFATLNALKAFRSESNISNQLAVEVLLYAAGERQIKKSMEILGVKPGTTKATVLIIAGAKDDAITTLNKVAKILGGKRDDSVMEIDTPQKYSSLKEMFRISDLEIEAKTEKKGLEKEALTDLIIERGALLTIER